ncbi:Transforming growth factor beta-1-induced transcript 1 protein, partial [Spiromyces aspiralis]
MTPGAVTTTANQQPDTMAAVCEVCRESLGEEYLSVHGCKFHVSHFVCHHCQIPLYALGGYFRDPNNGKRFYCQRDYLQRFSPRCQSCNMPITTGEMTVALGLKYHVECFVCTVCRSPFIGDVCYERDGKPLCEWHWHVQNGTLCAECGKSIHSRCVIVRNKKYHVDCVEALYNVKALSPDQVKK